MTAPKDIDWWDIDRKIDNLVEKIERDMDDPDGCWTWTGAVDRAGYGIFKLGTNGNNVKAHRAVYTFEVGPIPEDMTLDHTCRNTSCVRPDHLEVVPLAENIRRAHAARKAGE